MTTITFDTHKFIRTLKDAGVSEVQAEAFYEAFKEAQAESDLATKRDIVDLRRDIDVRFERVDGELKLNRWMLGVLLAGVISLVLKAFF
ncbi:MAG: CCDC90 family protein [Methylovulum sp.]|nr:CCDC90 family protein [Methylovulum sp.]MCF8007499.1 CCDC90 family protein [Methylovulum sp.]